MIVKSQEKNQSKSNDTDDSALASEKKSVSLPSAEVLLLQRKRMRDYRRTFRIFKKQSEGLQFIAKRQKQFKDQKYSQDEQYKPRIFCFEFDENLPEQKFLNEMILNKNTGIRVKGGKHFLVPISPTYHVQDRYFLVT